MENVRFKKPGGIVTVHKTTMVFYRSGNGRIAPAASFYVESSCVPGTVCSAYFRVFLLGVHDTPGTVYGKSRTTRSSNNKIGGDKCYGKHTENENPFKIL